MRSSSRPWSGTRVMSGCSMQARVVLGRPPGGVLLLLLALVVTTGCRSCAVAARREEASAAAAVVNYRGDPPPPPQQQQQEQQRAQPRSRRLLQLAAAADVGSEVQQDMPPAAMQQWLALSTPYSRRYASGSCFPDFRFIAKDMTELLRLLKDPAATQIELQGDMLFSTDLFPPENAHDKSKGLNISHEVSIRACRSPSAPIIVDVNNLLQQIYVYGRMSWQGSIRFINSFPSPRRAGLFPLVSILSVEADGVIEFKGVHIHGNEPSPLFDVSDPFWSVYQNDSAFVPQPSNYDRIAPHALILTHWTFNKTAWVLRSQGSHGVVRAAGSSSWHWTDVLVTWAPVSNAAGSGQLTGTSLALAIALPVVLGTALLVGAGVLLWRRSSRRRRGGGASTAASLPGKEAGSLFVHASGPSGRSKSDFASLGGGLSNTGTFGLESSHTGSSSLGTHALIEEARRRLQQGSGREAPIVLEGLLGEGTFGKVYRAHWKGSLVAVKTMFLPAAMSGKEKREKMAIMETAISSALSHPNVVQTYTYVVKPLSEELAMQMQLAGKPKAGLAPPVEVVEPGSDPSSLLDQQDGCEQHGWEVRLVLELCDLGNLKDYLVRGGFKTAEGQPNMRAILATALDVARAMHHLHTENIVHSDLKARNVLLKSAGGDARGFAAKVSDFGLSMRMDATETHVSNVYQGTLTHMAPEVLLRGKISRASDCYAFGILLWELYTGQQAFKGVPKALLGHEVAQLGRRPEFPPDCPFDYQLLAVRCWESDPAIRPSFDQLLCDLQRMASKLQPALSTGSGLTSPASTGPASPPAAAADAADAQAAVSPAATHAARLPSAAAAAGGAAAAVAGQQLLVPGDAAAAAAGARAGMGLDPAKLHHWEPQTSLLGSESTWHDSRAHEGAASSTAGPAAATGALSCEQQIRAQHAQLLQQQHPHQQHGVAAAAVGGSTSQPATAGNSMGSWGAASGGLWFGGSLAPENLPSNVHLPMRPDPAPAAVRAEAGAADGGAAPQQQPEQAQAQQQRLTADGSSMTSHPPASNAQSSSGGYVQPSLDSVALLTNAD